MLDFDHLLSAAWEKHGTDTNFVLSELPRIRSVISREEQVAPLARLVVHVYAEHLGRWSEGRDFLRQLRNLSIVKQSGVAQSSVDRSLATLDLCAGNETVLNQFGRSEQVSLLATASSALREQGKHIEADDYYVRALNLADTGIGEKDPSHRTLAITSNNLACTLEEKSKLTESDKDLMIRAALSARKYWALAGTWVEVQVAEYRLTMAFLKAGQAEEAQRHARECLRICEENRAGDLDMFFAYEALARSHKAAKNMVDYNSAVQKARELHQKMTDDNKKYSLTNLSGL